VRSEYITISIVVENLYEGERPVWGDRSKLISGGSRRTRGKHVMLREFREKGWPVSRGEKKEEKGTEIGYIGQLYRLTCRGLWLSQNPSYMLRGGRKGGHVLKIGYKAT